MEELTKCLKFESPHFPMAKKCCCCVPLRRGLLICSYSNLVFTLLSFPILIFMLVESKTTGEITVTSLTLEPHYHLPITIALNVIDVLLTIILLVGVHKKKRDLLKICFYAGMVYVLLTLVVDLTFFDFNNYAENISYVCVTVYNIYLLYLVYNTVYVLQQEALVQYVTYHEQPLL
ncbi:PREDICTED: uncharacterized protein LOC106101509 [Papilio polytes]|uniref:uncharacterized protein LOC106101509 n=1 Tax=Papilio polytes TaxID=76194 RepID=UPI000676A37A|nr:PREDICTED: uncharacterized protein LOC106101509 [Papilio polytes]XP_013136210.1 PREDICTED: uncharacterized protein LOC106101509 [Papilio polytes]XP_013136211.1 PREDICTED: uncharacterized protein LOC106101509 [Papilio polytes]XP_013136212.1 PREDICTED: uncharacterized protein LOC106101509 [Papilio polytes]